MRLVRGPLRCAGRTSEASPARSGAEQAPHAGVGGGVYDHGYCLDRFNYIPCDLIYLTLLKDAPKHHEVERWVTELMMHFFPMALPGIIVATESNHFLTTSSRRSGAESAVACSRTPDGQR